MSPSISFPSLLHSFWCFLLLSSLLFIQILIFLYLFVVFFCLLCIRYNDGHNSYMYIMLRNEVIMYNHKCHVLPDKDGINWHWQPPHLLYVNITCLHKRVQTNGHGCLLSLRVRTNFWLGGKPPSHNDVGGGQWPPRLLPKNLGFRGPHAYSSATFQLLKWAEVLKKKS